MTDLTIHKGCFNCKKFEKCAGLINKNIDYFTEIQKGRNEIPYRAGCCCANYELKKEKVEFT